MSKLFVRHQATRLLPLPLIALAVSGCVSTAPIVTSQSVSCIKLLPDSWKQGVEGVDWPSETATAADLWVALDRQTGKVDQANGRTEDIFNICTKVEQNNDAAVKRATKRWWQIF